MAAFVGVAATGAVIARAERRRRAYTPDQVRERLRERVARIEAREEAPPAPQPRTWRDRLAGRWRAHPVPHPRPPR
ncbi:hypothetical protein BJF83_07890 [Nocardiopsis sp. CNR-923]|nr:hypothetical protein [Nocardiopsis sp. CNR-923]OLT30624.1 hypothetical protein BJF83_07890 [Nocardiopsis sp. CNR-923]